MKVVLSGRNIEEYLKMAASYANQYGKEIFELEQLEDKQKENDYRLSVNYFSEKGKEAIIHCIEAKMNRIISSLTDVQGRIGDINMFVNVLPIKVFPAMRYNVDDDWSEIDNWDSLKLYQRKLRSMLPCDCKVLWVFTGIENVSLTNDFFERKGNREALKISCFDEWEKKKNSIQTTMINFFEEMEELDFVEKNGIDNIIWGFQTDGRNISNVGESTMAFWMIHMLDTILQFEEKYVLG